MVFGPEIYLSINVGFLVLKTINIYLLTPSGPVKYEIFNISFSHLRFSLSMMSDCTLNLFGGGSGGGL